MEMDPKEVLSDSFCDAIEQMAFMFAEPTERGDLPSRDTEYLQAQMSFSGDLDGSLTIAVPVAMCTEIAANVLGMDPDDEFVIERGADALKEVLNVACGRFLTCYAGEEPVFDLSVPETLRLDRAGWEALLAQPDTQPFLVDDYAALLSVTMRKETA